MDEVALPESGSFCVDLIVCFTKILLKGGGYMSWKNFMEGVAFFLSFLSNVFGVMNKIKINLIRLFDKPNNLNLSKETAGDKEGDAENHYIEEETNFEYEAGNMKYTKKRKSYRGCCHSQHNPTNSHNKKNASPKKKKRKNKK